MKLTLIEPQIWALDSAVNAIIETHNMDQLLNVALQKTSYGLGAQAGIILFLGEKNENRQMLIYTDGKVKTGQPQRINQKIIKKLIQSAAPLVWEQIKDYAPSALGIDLDWQPESIVYIPLMVEDKVLGLVGLASALPHFFQKRGMSWFSFWGKQLGVVIHKLQLEWQLKKSRRESITLGEVTNIMGYSIKLEEMLNLVLDKTLGLFEMKAGGIYILNNQQDDKLKLVASKGLPDYLIETVEREQPPDGLKYRILRSASPLVLSNPFRCPDVDELLKQSGYQSFAGVPLKTDRGVWGIMILFGMQEQHKLSESETEFLCMVGNAIANTLEKDALFKQLICAKSEWEMTFDYITDMVAILDDDFTILRANVALATKFNKHPREIVGTKCYQLFHGGVGPPPNCPCIKTLSTGKPCTKEVEMANLGGTFLLSTSSIPNGNKKIDRVTYVARDITAHKTLEHQLLQMQKMECIGNLAGGIAHDFSNLLEGILGYAGYVKQKLASTDPLYGEVQCIENIALKGANLTHQLMDFARHGKTRLVPVKINDMVHEVTKLLTRTIKKNVHIKKSLNQELPMVKGDEAQLQQIILNICLNARDAMPGGGKIEISTENVRLDEEITEINPWAEPGDYIRLSISDTGCGIDDKTQEKIFDPFFTTKQGSKGTGLGLASVYRLVKNHQGHVQVKSKVGQGTTFEVYLPVWKKKEKILNKEAETILIVDNEEMIRKKAQTVLRNKGFKVLVAGDNQAAIDILNKQGDNIDLVILDLVSPNINNDQNYNILKRIRSNIRVLLSSDYNLSRMTTKNLSKRSAGILRKPYQPRDLLQKVNKALGK
jgi:signal transduction histidine kinase/CheY-like chemotaxis protein